MRYFILVLCVLLSGCSSTTLIEEPGMEGYVVKKEGNRILVVDSVPKDYSSSGGVQEFYNAIWFSNAPAEATLGQKVKVWFDVVAESYPGQSEVKQIKILSSKQPDKADLNESEAISKALIAKVINENEIPIIKSAEYHVDKDMWNIEIKQGVESVVVKVGD